MAEISRQPPKSVLIQPGRDPDLEIEALEPVEERTELSDAVQNYLSIRALKPEKGLTVLGTIFLIIPFLLVLSGGDVFDLGAICCLSFLIGFVLITINSTQTSSWNKDMKAARNRVELSDKIPYTPASQWSQGVGFFFAVGSLFAMDLDEFLFLLALLLAFIFLVYYQVRVFQHDKVYDERIDAFIQQLRAGLDNEENSPR
jgi:L-asparagine transporter-like permease